MARTEAFFATRIYRGQLAVAANAALAKVCLAIAREDVAGQRWAKAHGYRGYTSYASLDDLPRRAPEFAELVARIEPHVRRFARELQFARTRLALDSLWLNVMAPGAVHGAHIHPHSAISGTYYVALPKGASAIRFEDPRLPLMMAAPIKREGARDKPFVTIAPKPGTLLLWESCAPRRAAKRCEAAAYLDQLQLSLAPVSPSGTRRAPRRRPRAGRT